MLHLCDTPFASGSKLALYSGFRGMAVVKQPNHKKFFGYLSFGIDKRGISGTRVDS